MVALRYAARSDIGLGRRNNQDSGYAGTNLLVVADGMGGHAGGDVASSLAISRLALLDSDAPGADALQELESAIHSAADSIRQRVSEEPDLAGMGTTVTAILRHGNRLALAHIGDSRAYLLRDGELTQVTVDHTFVQRLVDDGKISADDAAQHPQRNIVMRVIGDVEAPEDIDTSVRETIPGDRWLICSDGLSGPVSKDTLTETLVTVSDPAACADQLIDLALRAGGNDNITCVVADVVPESRAGTTAPQVVGAAAITRDQPTRAIPNSPAARAAALTRPEAADDPDADDYAEDDDHRPRPFGWKLIAGVVVTVALLIGGVYGAWVWSQRQYFVGESEGKVAIYSGLSEDIGAISLSTLYERAETLPVDTLDQTNQERVRAGIGADDLADARRIVINLYQQSSVCTPTGFRPNPNAASPTAQPTTGTTQTGNGTSAVGSVNPDPTAPTTLPVPEECEQ